MFDGGLFLMPDPFNDVRNIFNHMVIKDCYEAGLISEDVWKGYLKKLANKLIGEEDK